MGRFGDRNGERPEMGRVRRRRPCVIGPPASCLKDQIDDFEDNNAMLEVYRGQRHWGGGHYMKKPVYRTSDCWALIVCVCFIVGVRDIRTEEFEEDRILSD